MVVDGRRSRRATLALLVLLSGCSSYSTEEERQAALAALDACARPAIARLDDRVSPADAVAKGVLGACEGERQAAWEVFRRERENVHTGAYGSAVTRRIGELLEGRMTALVLEHRRGR
jgi:hypothetical protein